MAIAIMLMGMAAAGYFGYIRGGLVNRAAGNVRAKIMLARQRAVTGRRTVYLVPGGGTLRVYEALGRQANPNSKSVPQQLFLSDLPVAALSLGTRVYKPDSYDSGAMGTEAAVTAIDASASGLNAGTLKWLMDEPCAVLIDEYPVPDGIVIDTPAGESSPEVLEIYADGTVSENGIIISVKERIGKLQMGVVVFGISGRVELGERYAY